MMHGSLLLWILTIHSGIWSVRSQVDTSGYNFNISLDLSDGSVIGLLPLNTWQTTSSPSACGANAVLSNTTSGKDVYTTTNNSYLTAQFKGVAVFLFAHGTVPIFAPNIQLDNAPLPLDGSFIDPNNPCNVVSATNLTDEFHTLSIKLVKGANDSTTARLDINAIVYTQTPVDTVSTPPSNSSSDSTSGSSGPNPGTLGGAIGGAIGFIGLAISLRWCWRHCRIKERPIHVVHSGTVEYEVPRSSTLMKQTRPDHPPDLSYQYPPSPPVRQQTYNPYAQYTPPAPQAYYNAAPPNPNFAAHPAPAHAIQRAPARSNTITAAPASPTQLHADDRAQIVREVAREVAAALAPVQTALQAPPHNEEITSPPPRYQELAPGTAI